MDLWVGWWMLRWALFSSCCRWVSLFCCIALSTLLCIIIPFQPIQPSLCCSAFSHLTSEWSYLEAKLDAIWPMSCKIDSRARVWWENAKLLSIGFGWSSQRGRKDIRPLMSSERWERGDHCAQWERKHSFTGSNAKLAMFQLIILPSTLPRYKCNLDIGVQRWKIQIRPDCVIQFTHHLLNHKLNLLCSSCMLVHTCFAVDYQLWCSIHS
jgi:hypothetical protein